MSASEGARPKRRIKPVYDPDFVYDLPVNSLFSDNLLEPQLDTRSATQPKERPPVSSSKSKASTSPLSATTTPTSTLTFDQQLQLVQLQKEKLELELKVLECQRERPLHSLYSELHIGDASTKDSTVSRKPKQTIDWPQDFVPGVQGEYDKLDLSEFSSGFLLMIKGYGVAEKEASLSQLELLMTKSISYTWSSVRAFHKFIAKQVEQRRITWQDTKDIQDQANTFFRHSDLRHFTRQEAPLATSGIFNGSSTPKSNTNTTTKACKAWNYTGACECEKDTTTYKDHHRCRVCKADHPMLHCPKRRSPIPASPP